MLIQRLDQIRLEVSPMLDPNRRSKLGQFMTPGRIAADMAAMFDVIPAHVRLLDAGAGMGALTAAFVAEACARPERPRSIDATCYEIDPVLVVVLEEEAQVLIGHVDLGVAAEFAVFFDRHTAARESVLVDLVLDLVGRVAHENGGFVDRGGHLGAGALEGGQEEGVDQGGFGVGFALEF